MLTKSDADRKRGRMRVMAALLSASLAGFGAAAPAWATPSPSHRPTAGQVLPRDTSSARITASSTGSKETGLVSNVWGSISGFSGSATVSTQVLVNGKWSTSQQAKNVTSGYVLPLTYGANTPGTNRWRVVATDGTRTAVSPEFTFTRTGRTAVTASSTGTRQVGIVSNVWGSISGFPGSATVSTQVLVNGKWSTSQQAKNVTSGYVLPLTYGANTPGTNRWRVVATDGTRTAVSPEFTFTRTPAPPKPSGPYSVTKGANTSDRVALTYDDCPKSLKAFKDTVLAAEEANVGLALFPTGDCIKAGRFDADFAREHGMHVFNHSISHPDLTTLSQAGAQKELGAPGVVTTYGRPPYGAYNNTVKAAYAAVGMKIWTWTVDTNDWRGKSQSEVVSYVTSTAKGGDTVLMHMQWNAFNGTAIKDMKKGLEAKGIKLCRNYDGTVPAKPADMWC